MSAHSRDPRTVGRKIVGIFETVFPRLVPGVVGYMNKRSFSFDSCVQLDGELVEQSRLQHAMLFELAMAVGETLLSSTEHSVDWDACFRVAVSRQRRYYDAVIPSGVGEIDRVIALQAAKNLVSMLSETIERQGEEVTIQPPIPGFGWIACGLGDYATARTIIEVKCRAGRFSSADYRQIVMYWILSYLKALEANTETWETGLLLNPRRNRAVEFKFHEFVPLISGGRTLAEVAEALRNLVLHEQK